MQTLPTDVLDLLLSLCDRMQRPRPNAAAAMVMGSPAAAQGPPPAPLPAPAREPAQPVPALAPAGASVEAGGGGPSSRRAGDRCKGAAPVAKNPLTMRRAALLNHGNTRDVLLTGVGAGRRSTSTQMDIGGAGSENVLWVLRGRMAATHAYLAASAAVVVNALLNRGPSAEFVPSVAAAAAVEVVRSAAAAITAWHSTVGEAAAAMDAPQVLFALTEGQLAVLVGMLDSSPQGAAQGSLGVWLAARAGCARRLGQLRAIEGVTRALGWAAKEMATDETRYLHARWACAALWRLSVEKSNGSRTLSVSIRLLLRLLEDTSYDQDADASGEIDERRRHTMFTMMHSAPSAEARARIESRDGLRTSVLACLAQMLHQRSLLRSLCTLRVPHAIREVTLAEWLPLSQRMSALRAIDAAADGLAEHESSAGGSRILIDFVLTLVDDGQLEMRCLACRVQHRGWSEAGLVEV